MQKLEVPVLLMVILRELVESKEVVAELRSSQLDCSNINHEAKLIFVVLLASLGMLGSLRTGRVAT